MPADAHWHLVSTTGLSSVITYQRPAISAGDIVQSKTTGLQKDLWRTFAGHSTTGSFANGDVLLLTGRARCLETTNTTALGIIQAHFEFAVPPYPKLFTTQFTVPKDWTRFSIPFVLNQEIPAGKGKVIFNTGYAVQFVEFCDVQLYRFASGFDITRLPATEHRTPKR